MKQIFISYRRDDSGHAAGRLCDRLRQHFPSDRVFMDIDAIELGVDFRGKIEEEIGACDVVLVLIGREWLKVTGVDGRQRLEDPDDYVRLELATALKRNINVIPILLEGAGMPAEAKLPDELRLLARRNGMEIRHAQFQADAGTLIKGLEAIFQKKKPEQVTMPKPVEAPGGKPSTKLKILAAVGVVAAWVTGWGLAILVQSNTSGGGHEADLAAAWVVWPSTLGFLFLTYWLWKRKLLIASSLAAIGMSLFVFILLAIHVL